VLQAVGLAPVMLPRSSSHSSSLASASRPHHAKSISLSASSSLPLRARLSARSRLTNLGVLLLSFSLAFSLLLHLRALLRSGAVPLFRGIPPPGFGSWSSFHGLTPANLALNVPKPAEGAEKLDHLVVVVGHAVWGEFAAESGARGGEERRAHEGGGREAQGSAKTSQPGEHGCDPVIPRLRAKGAQVGLLPSPWRWAVGVDGQRGYHAQGVCTWYGLAPPCAVPPPPPCEPRRAEQRAFACWGAAVAGGGAEGGGRVLGAG
jgi:hypothetical protein